jgi:hypothetical protein
VTNRTEKASRESTSLNSPWAVCLASADLAAAGRLRLVAGIEVCRVGQEVWLRGQQLDEALERHLRAVPGARRFWVLPDRQIRSPMSRVPKGWLPEGPWAPLARWMGAEFPQSGPAGKSDQRVPLTLVRSTVPEEPGILLVEVPQWAAYAAEAPEVRLQRWTFALAADGRVAVRGQPLPPLRGERFIEYEGIAVPAGWTWSPPVEPAVVRELLTLEPGDVALWRTDGSWERIATADFVRASRAAARLANVQTPPTSPSGTGAAT